MSQEPLNRPPNPDDPMFPQWLYNLWKRVSQTGQVLWSQIDFTGSNLTDIATRNHADLQNINTASYTHLTSTQATDLTDAGDSTLHYHSSDRAWANQTGTPTTLSGYGISDTMANFDASCSDGNFAYQNQAATFTTLETTGNVGIGSAKLTNTSASISGNYTGATTTRVIDVSGIILSDSTTAFSAFRTFYSTQSAAVTFNSVISFNAGFGGLGSGSSINNLIGYYAHSSLNGATNVIGFYGEISNGTGKYNLYLAGTADNYMSGALGIGSAPIAGINLYVNKNLTGNTTSYNVASYTQVQSDVTGTATGFTTLIGTVAASFTLSSLIHYRAIQGTIGVGSSVSNQRGFEAMSTLIGAANNYGFFGNIASGTGRWNFFAAGTANNAYAGNSRFGGTTAPTVAVDVTGAVLATTTITSSGATSGIGYSTGAGGTVTQATSRTTGVTINKVSGAITLVSAAGSVTPQTFTVTNSAVAATDTIVVNQKSGADLNIIHVTAVAAGSFNITFWTTGGTTTEQPVFSFNVIKGVTA